MSVGGLLSDGPLGLEASPGPHSRCRAEALHVRPLLAEHTGPLQPRKGAGGKKELLVDKKSTLWGLRKPQ